MDGLWRFDARRVNFLRGRALTPSSFKRFRSQAVRGLRGAVGVLVLRSAVQVAKSRRVLDETQVDWNAVLSGRAESAKTMRLKMAKFEAFLENFLQTSSWKTRQFYPSGCWVRSWRTSMLQNTVNGRETEQMSSLRKRNRDRKVIKQRNKS